MPKRAIVPPEMAGFVRDWRMSPGLEANGFVFFTGLTGVDVDGAVSADAATQIEVAFSHVGLVLAEAGLAFSDIVEVTSFHVGLRDHLAAFKAAWAARMAAPYPAWTAIEVAGFVTEGVAVELRVIAQRPDPGGDAPA